MNRQIRSPRQNVPSIGLTYPFRSINLDKLLSGTFEQPRQFAGHLRHVFQMTVGTHYDLNEYYRKQV